MRVPAEVGEDLLPPLGHRGQGGHQEPAQGDDDGHDDGVGDGDDDDDDDYDFDDNEDSASALEVEIDDSSEKIIFYVYDATFAKKYAVNIHMRQCSMFMHMSLYYHKKHEANFYSKHNSWSSCHL